MKESTKNKKDIHKDHDHDKSSVIPKEDTVMSHAKNEKPQAQDEIIDRKMNERPRDNI